MLGLILALVSSLIYGCADFAGGLATRGAHVLRVVAVAAPVSLVLELLLLPVVGGHWSASAVWWGVASGVASAASFALLYQCLALGPMSVLSPVTALISAVLPATVGLLLGERLGWLSGSAVVLALVSVLVITAAGEEGGLRPTLTALMLALGAGLAIAAQLVCLARAPHASGVVPLVVGRGVSTGLLLLAFLFATGHLGPDRPHVWMTVVAGVMDATANSSFLFAVRHGSLVVVAVITALYPASTVLLARFVLGERLARIQVAGLLLAAVAVSVLAVAPA